MRALSAVLLIIFAHSAVGQTIADQLGSADRTLTVSLRQTRDLPASVKQSMYEEVEALFAPTGIRVNWESHDASAPNVASRLAIVRITGRCEPDAPSAVLRFQKSTAESLGDTQVVDGAVVPFAEVRCDAIRKFISAELRGTSSANRERLLGRAVGRVLAHELYHVALRTRAHGHEGVAKPAQSSVDLVAERTSFTREEERRIAEATPADAVGIVDAAGR